MNDSSLLKTVLEKPKLTLFAFQIYQELTQDEVADAQEIWQHIAEVGTRLNISELEHLPEKIHLPHQNNQTGRSQVYPQELLLSKSLSFECTDKAIKGEIYPIQIHDTYAIDLTFRPTQEKINLSELASIHPQGLLAPSQICASLGQTWLFFAKLVNDYQDLELIARECLKKLISTNSHLNLDAFSPLGSGKLLGGEIYQFEDDANDPRDRQHIIIWLATDDRTVDWEAKGEYYFSLLNLLLCRTKIQFFYDRAYQSYQQGRQFYGQLEPIVREFSQWKDKQNQWFEEELTRLATTTKDLRWEKQVQGLLNPSQENLQAELLERVKNYLQKNPDRRLETKLKEMSQLQLQTFEKWLLQMPLTNINYDRCLRDLQTQLTSITINNFNYQNYLEKLQVFNPDDDLSFLAQFMTEDCDRYQKQIRCFLDYLSTGKNLFEPTIQAIRGLLEIEAQKQQLAEELAEKERDRSIEVWVTVVGSGLAVSSITTGIISEPVQPIFEHYNLKYVNTWYGSPVSLLILNVLFHSVVGILSAILVAIVAKGAIEKFIRFVSDRVQRF